MALRDIWKICGRQYKVPPTALLPSFLITAQQPNHSFTLPSHLPIYSSFSHLPPVCSFSTDRSWFQYHLFFPWSNSVIIHDHNFYCQSVAKKQDTVLHSGAGLPHDQLLLLLSAKKSLCQTMPSNSHSREYKFSFTNWLAGGDPVVPRKRKSATKKLANAPPASLDTGDTGYDYNPNEESDSSSSSSEDSEESDSSTELVPLALRMKNKQRKSAPTKCLKKCLKTANGNGRKSGAVCLKKLNSKSNAKQLPELDSDNDSSHVSGGTDTPLHASSGDISTDGEDTAVESSANETPSVATTEAAHTSDADEATQTNEAAETSGAETTDAESTEAEKEKSGTETKDAGQETIKDSKDKGQAKNSGGNDWTASQDAIILAMKQGGETWAAISGALGRGKNEVRQRWKELAKNGTTATQTTPTAEIEVDKGNEADDVQGQRTKKRGRKNRKTNGMVPRSSVGSDADGEWSASDEFEAQKRHQEHVYAMLTRLPLPEAETERPIEPDDHFSPLDCKVLATLDSRHKVTRWLELQAAFFNATGRMVPLELLKHKLGAGEG